MTFLESKFKPSILIIVFIIFSNSISGQDWIPLFNGNDFTNWEHVGDGEFIIEDGLLKTVGGMGLLYYKEHLFENVELKVIYKNPNNHNAGVFIRIPEPPTEAWMPVNKGYEVQIDDRLDEYHYTGVLYSLTKAMAKAPVRDLNTMIITLKGDTTLVEVNGELITNYTEGDPVPEKKIWYEPDRGPRPSKGYIGLQNHGVEDVVYFKEISYRKLESK